MDFGVMTMESLMGSDNGASLSLAGSEPEPNNPKNHGSGFLKQDRSGLSEDHNWRSSKMARTDDAFEASKTMSYQQQQGNLLRSNPVISCGDAQNMLSFSSPSSTTSGGEALFPSKNGGLLVERTTQNAAFRLYQQPPAYIRNAGCGSGALNAGVHSPFARYRGPFTPSQWMELEHQALIYKHIVANAPIPSNLLISLRKSLNTFAFSGSSSGSYAPNSFGWGTFHLGFAGNSDPEPGRCRRTDGKKWRCSRDAVPEQKYCERHINRGRHRSRKPVEGQNGHAVSGSTTSKVVPIASSPSASVLSSGTTNNSLDPTQLQFKSLQPVGSNPSIDTVINRMQDNQGLSMISPTISLKSKDSPFSIPKHVAFEESSHSEFGRITSDSLIYPSQKSSNTNVRNSSSFLGFDDHDWPKDQSDRATITWAEELKSDWTRLSMSIPMASSDFSTSSNSPPQEKLALSPLSLSHEFDPIQLGASIDHSESGHKQTNWIPISWGNSMGGPLGEVLNSTSCTEGASKNSMGSSPTGVLQKASFVSLSNSSSGSSPRGGKEGRPSLW